jgi:hypothetical protein
MRHSQGKSTLGEKSARATKYKCIRIDPKALFK